MWSRKNVADVLVVKETTSYCRIKPLLVDTMLADCQADAERFAARPDCSFNGLSFCRRKVDDLE
jgi:hypothetical protein